MPNKPILLFYCQHSLGMGHLVRALTLAETLAEKFSVLFLNGGRMPANTLPPTGIEVLNLPPLGMAEDNSLYSQDERYSLEEAQVLRKKVILSVVNEYQPQAILIELFPFGRKKFAGELLPLLKSAKRYKKNKPFVLCSLRDIMVSARKDQLRHDNRASWLVDRYFDGVLIHSDPKFASLEESFSPSRLMKSPIFYTGFILPREEAIVNLSRQKQVLVSAGGGIVGARLFEVAIKAQPILWDKLKLPMTIVAGPFLPENDWQQLKIGANNCPGLTLHRSVPTMTGMLASHSVSVSQCGYNTVMDILKSGIAALVVPFAQGQEDEQTNRASRLSALGLIRQVPDHELDVLRFVTEVEHLLTFHPKENALDINGTQRSVEIIYDMMASNKVDSSPDEKSTWSTACG